MNISNVNSELSSYITSSTKAASEQNSFQELLNNAMENNDAEGLKKACQDFEGYYIQKLFNEMRKTVPKSDLFEKSQGRDIYEDMLYEEYSKTISTGQGVGLADMLYKQLSKNIESKEE